MTGIEYWRRKMRLKQSQLSKLAGLATGTVISYEHSSQDEMQIKTLLRLSDALSVPIDMLAAEYDENELLPGDHHIAPSASLEADNIIARYRKAENLRLTQLAARLGYTSRERARQICVSDTVRKEDVNTLCKFEGIDRKTFYRLYGKEESA